MSKKLGTFMWWIVHMNVVRFAFARGMLGLGVGLREGL